MPKTGRPAEPLTRRRILEAALRVVDAEGLPALNMRRIGAELDVRATALYRHVENRDAIVAGVVDLVFEDLHVSMPQHDAVEAARRFFRSLRSVLAAHPNALPLVAASALQQDNARAQTEAVVQAMTDAGMDGAWSVFHALASFTLGYTLLEVGGFVGGIPDRGPFVRRPMPGTASGRPSAAESDARFEDSLDLFLGAVQPRGRPPHGGE